MPVGALPGFEVLDRDATLTDKLITPNTLRPARVAADNVQGHFFDLTAHSRGVLTSVRTGHLKKDLSLLFEKDKSRLPSGEGPRMLISRCFRGDLAIWFFQL